MDSFPLYSCEQLEEEKNLYNSPDSLSPTPSPQPLNAHLYFTQEAGEGQAEMGSVRVRRGRKNLQEARAMNRGHWSVEENKRYHWFLEIHYRHFVNRHMRRMDKIFKSMELFVGTRQAEQCRSHHQKMEKKYHNFITIISNLRNIHYSSSELTPILEDLTSLGISAGEGLATIEQLKALEGSCVAPVEVGKQRKKSSVVARNEREEPKPAMKEEFKEEPHHKEENKEEEAFHANMLDESNNNIGELSLIHEDNSCLFHCFFK